MENLLNVNLEGLEELVKEGVGRDGWKRVMWHKMKRVKLEDYELKGGETEADVAKLMEDPLWRLCNLYVIKDAEGREGAFVPNEAQRIVLWAVYVAGWKRLAIPKARQLGLSTLFALICLDETLFSKGKQASIVDQTQSDAQEKLDKVKYAYERLPKAVKEKLRSENGTELEWVNGGRVVAGKRARGGTNQVLHISEWGPIACDDASRSREIMTGALPSVSGVTGKVFAESTHKGGMGGDWYNLLKNALETPDEEKTSKDFRVLFFPWWMEKRYALGGKGVITEDTKKYFKALEERLEWSVSFTEEQMRFYQGEAKRLRFDVYSEYPSVIEECWLAPTPGAIYAASVGRARGEGRISGEVEWRENLPVFTAFDIGAPENTKCWVFQLVGDRVVFLESLTGGDACQTPAQWVKRLKEMKYSWGGHTLPHDGDVVWRRSMLEAGLRNVSCLKRSVNVWDVINPAVDAFGRAWFAKKGCEEGVKALEAYHAKEEADGQTLRNMPVHNWASHYSTAFGYAMQAIARGLANNSTMGGDEMGRMGVNARFKGSQTVMKQGLALRGGR